MNTKKLCSGSTDTQSYTYDLTSDTYRKSGEVLGVDKLAQGATRAPDGQVRACKNE